MPITVCYTSHDDSHDKIHVPGQRASGHISVGLVPPQASFGANSQPCSEQFIEDLNG